MMLPITPYQVITPVLSLLAVAYAWNLVLRQRKTIWEASLWTVLWGAVAAVAVFPGLLSYLTLVTGIRDRENAVLVTLLGLLFFIVFYLIMRMEELDQRQKRMIRTMALKDAELERGKRGGA